MDDLFSTNSTPGSNLFRDNWLTSVSQNTNLNDAEKDLLSNMIYISNAFSQVVSNEGSPIERPHPWEIRFRTFMRDEVPNGPFKSVAWVVSGSIFLDVGDCIGTASNWW